MKNIIKKFTVAAVALTIAACGNEQKEVSTDLVNNPASGTGETVNKEDLPAFEFEKETYDFGTITQGEKVSFTYKFKNAGNTDLIISSAKGSCGCTVPDYPKHPIAPGEEGKIDVVFDSEGKSGKQNKSITIVANTYPNTKVIHLTGEIVAPK